jgi:hypothetical protein
MSEAELRAEIERLNRELASERARVTELENKVEAVESQSTESDESAESGSKETPMQQLIEAGEAGVIGHVTPSIRRARAIAENFPKWSKKTPSGFVIRDGLKNLVETATGESLFHKQIERACNALAEFTNGAIAFKNHREHGWMLIAQPDDHRYRSLSAAGG